MTDQNALPRLDVQEYTKPISFEPIMNSRSTSLRTALVSSIIAAALFLFKDRETATEEYVIKHEETCYKYLELHAQNVDEITTDKWKVLIVSDMDKRYSEKIGEDIKTTNVALLKVDTFEKARLATIFGIRKLPEEFVVVDGVLENGNDLRRQRTDFWRAVEIELFLMYMRAYMNLSERFKELVHTAHVFVSKAYYTTPLFQSVVYIQ